MLTPPALMMAIWGCYSSDYLAVERSATHGTNMRRHEPTRGHRDTSEAYTRMDVTPDRHTRWYQGIQRIYRNAVVRHLRTTLRDEYPQEWESVLQRPFAQEWSTIVENADLPRKIGAIKSALRDAADYLGVNHFYNLFDVHFELLFPAQGEIDPVSRKQERAAVLSWAKEIKTVRDPESHPPSEDMDFHDVVRQLDTARRICSKFDRQAADELEALMSHLYSDRPTDVGPYLKEASHRQTIQASPRSRLDAEALLLGPVQALGLTFTGGASPGPRIQCASRHRPPLCRDRRGSP